MPIDAMALAAICVYGAHDRAGLSASNVFVNRGVAAAAIEMPGLAPGGFRLVNDGQESVRLGDLPEPAERNAHRGKIDVHRASAFVHAAARRRAVGLLFPGRVILMGLPLHLITAEHVAQPQIVTER